MRAFHDHMRRPVYIAASLLSALVLALLPGCGGDEEAAPIPAERAAALLEQLDEIDRRVRAGACNDVERGSLVRLDRQLERLPEDVDPDVRDALEDGAGTLRRLVEEECDQTRDERERTETQETETTAPPPITTAPPPTTTTPPETETETDDTDTTEPPDTGDRGGGVPAPGEDSGGVSPPGNGPGAGGPPGQRR